jgi:hypothetical protein
MSNEFLDFVEDILDAVDIPQIRPRIRHILTDYEAEGWQH